MDDRLKAQRAKRFPGESYVPAAEQKKSQVPSVMLVGAGPPGPMGPQGPQGEPGIGGSTNTLTSTDIGVTVSSFGHAHSTSYAALGHDHSTTYAALVHAHSATSIESGTMAAARLPNLAGLTAPSSSVDFNGQQATSFRLQNSTADPGSPTTGQIWLRTDL